MPTLRNGRHERFAQGIVKGLTVDAAYTGAGFRPHRGNASRLRANESVKVRIEELMKEIAAQTVLSARWAIEELAKNHARAVAKNDLTSSNRALELIGRHFGAWRPEDSADATQNHIPLAERLKFYQREAAIDGAGEKVVRLTLEESLSGRVKP